MTNLNIAKLSLAALAFAALATAQDTKETPKASPASKPGCCVQQVYQVKHANVRDLYQLLFTRAGQDQTPYLGYNESLKAISIYGTQSEVRSIMANLAALDVPSAGRGVLSGNAEITFWLISASTSGEAYGDPIPQDLMPALKAVAGSFGYKSFNLLASAISLTQSGGGFSVRGNATPPSPKLANRVVSQYNLGSDPVRIEAAGNARNVSLTRFNFRMQVPYCADAECARFIEGAGIDINGSFNIREGQKVVIGKSKMDGTNKDLILIVSAKVVD